MQTTTAGESSSAARSFDSDSCARALMFDIDVGSEHHYDRNITDAKSRTSHWEEQCNHMPMAMGTYCTSLYDICDTPDSILASHRVALDCLAAPASLEQFGVAFRPTPTAHRFADRVTTCIRSDVLATYLGEVCYALKYAHVIT